MMADIPASEYGKDKSWRDAFFEAHGREPTAEELANLSAEEVELAKNTVSNNGVADPDAEESE